MESTTNAVSIAAFTAAGSLGRYYLDREWIRAGWRYATDGRCAARIPADGEPDTPDEGPQAMFPNAGSFFADHDFAGCVTPLPASSGETVGRPCDEEHRIVDECGECGGRGEHECDCGDVHDCAACGGSGKTDVKAEQHPRTCACQGAEMVQEPIDEIGGCTYAGKYLEKVRALPTARYCIEPGEGEWRLFLFVAEGGLQGVLGPIRRAAKG